MAQSNGTVTRAQLKSLEEKVSNLTNAQLGYALLVSRDLNSIQDYITRGFTAPVSAVDPNRFFKNILSTESLPDSRFTATHLRTTYKRNYAVRYSVDRIAFSIIDRPVNVTVDNKALSYLINVKKVDPALYQQDLLEAEQASTWFTVTHAKDPTMRSFSDNLQAAIIDTLVLGKGFLYIVTSLFEPPPKINGKYPLKPPEDPAKERQAKLQSSGSMPLLPIVPSNIDVNSPITGKMLYITALDPESIHLQHTTRGIEKAYQVPIAKGVVFNQEKKLEDKAAGITVNTKGQPQIQLNLNNLIILELVSRSNSLDGLPIIESIADEIAAYFRLVLRLAVYSDIGAIDPGIISLSGVSEEEIKRLRASLKERDRGNQMAIADIMPPAELKFVQLAKGLDPIQIEIIKRLEKIIFKAFGHLPIEEGPNILTTEYGSHFLKTSELTNPIVRTLEEKLNWYMFNIRKVPLKISFAPPIASDLNTMLNMVNAGVLSRNDVRQQMGLLPIEGGDLVSILSPTGLTPLNGAISRIVPGGTPEQTEVISDEG